MPQDTNADALWGVEEVAPVIRKSVNGVYKMVEKRLIPHIRMGRKILFDPAEIRRWLEGLTVRPVEPRSVTVDGHQEA